MEVGQLRWRCRRGMKELDVLLSRYVDSRLAADGSPERAAFEQLLESQDPLIYGYCFGQTPVPEAFRPLIARIIAP
jgi:antitoxin CptB